MKHYFDESQEPYPYLDVPPTKGFRVNKCKKIDLSNLKPGMLIEVSEGMIGTRVGEVLNKRSIGVNDQVYLVRVLSSESPSLSQRVGETPFWRLVPNKWIKYWRVVKREA